MLFLIGLGLGDERDITIKGKDRIASADNVYLEGYTSILASRPADLARLEEFLGKKITVLQRNGLEEESQQLLDAAKKKQIAVLIVGDPLSATTHIELYRAALEQKIPCEIIHNASIITVVAETGLQIYKFGRTGSIPFPPSPSSNPSLETPYNVLGENRARGLHTLLLLDLNPAEQRFLGIKDALQVLLDIEERKEKEIFTHETFCIGCARLGSSDQKIVAGTVHELQKISFGEPPFCLIVPGELHFLEGEMLEFWKILDKRSSQNFFFPMSIFD